jgi:hypothetical protein
MAAAAVYVHPVLRRQYRFCFLIVHDTLPFWRFCQGDGSSEKSSAEPLLLKTITYFNYLHFS